MLFCNCSNYVFSYNKNRITYIYLSKHFHFLSFCMWYDAPVHSWFCLKACHTYNTLCLLLSVLAFLLSTAHSAYNPYTYIVLGVIDQLKIIGEALELFDETMTVICQLNLCATVKNRPLFSNFSKNANIRKTLVNTGFARVLVISLKLWKLSFAELWCTTSRFETVLREFLSCFSLIFRAFPAFCFLVIRCADHKKRPFFIQR